MMRILLADDNAIIRETLANLLGHNTALDIVGEASDGEMAVELARDLWPDVVIMDIRMPKMNGIEATRRIKSDNPETKVIAFSMYAKTRLCEAILQAGAVSCISKADPIEVLIRAIHACYPSNRPASGRRG